MFLCQWPREPSFWITQLASSIHPPDWAWSLPSLFCRATLASSGFALASSDSSSNLNCRLQTAARMINCPSWTKQHWKFAILTIKCRKINWHENGKIKFCSTGPSLQTYIVRIPLQHCNNGLLRNDNKIAKLSRLISIATLTWYKEISRTVNNSNEFPTGKCSAPFWKQLKQQRLLTSEFFSPNSNMN